MSLLGRKYPAPVAKPMLPFAAAGLIMMYAINSGANAMKQTEPYKSDPRNPDLQNKKH